MAWGPVPVGVIYQNDSNQWVHHYNSLLMPGMNGYLMEDNYYVKLTLENIYCTRTRTLYYQTITTSTSSNRQHYMDGKRIRIKWLLLLQMGIQEEVIPV